MSFLNKNSTFWGFRRENGRVGEIEEHTSELQSQR